MFLLWGYIIDLEGTMIILSNIVMVRTLENIKFSMFKVKRESVSR